MWSAPKFWPGAGKSGYRNKNSCLILNLHLKRTSLSIFKRKRITDNLSSWKLLIVWANKKFAAISACKMGPVINLSCGGFRSTSNFLQSSAKLIVRKGGSGAAAAWPNFFFIAALHCCHCLQRRLEGLHSLT